MKENSENKRVMLLPIAQNQLCFDKNDFVQKDFCVDQFVAKCRQKVSLETLRENLEMYFKLLKNAMIELINKDYADFVNLSSNLVGMDKSIEVLRAPLNKINRFVEQTEELMRSKVEELELILQKDNALKEKRKLLKHMKGLIDAVDKIEHIQNSNEFRTVQVSERIAGEFNQLQHHAVFCKGLPLLVQMRPRIAEITGNLQVSLERELVDGIVEGDGRKIHRCLNSYALIGKNSDAEQLVAIHIIAPQLEQIVSDYGEGELTTAKLKIIFNKILEFLSGNLRFICDISTGRKTRYGEQYRGILGYDFIVNSAWPSIVNCFEQNLSDMFQTQDSDLYHERYMECMKLVGSVERLCGSQTSIASLRLTPAYTNLITHWSLPMYFQIRFQQIGASFVASLARPNPDSSSSPLRLGVSAMLLNCIEACWHKKVFILALAHRFWKLTLQLISRYETWIVQMMPKEGGDLNGKFEMKELAMVVHDIGLLRTSISKLYEEKMSKELNRLDVENPHLFAKAIDGQVEKLMERRSEIVDLITKQLIHTSTPYLKQIQNVPRLFRKTNRAEPTVASAYVTSLVKSCLDFYERQHELSDTEVLGKCINAFVNDISHKFYEMVNDVLVSVRKMEESLIRLHKMRQSSSKSSLAAAAASPSASDGAKMSDDDKIRKQLYIDVTTFHQHMTACGADIDNNESYQKLFQLVLDSYKK